MTFIFNKTAFASVLICFLTLTSASFGMEQKKVVKSVLNGGSPDYEAAMDFIRNNLPPLLPKELTKEFIDDDDEKIRERILSAMKLYPPEQIAPFWIEILKNSNGSPFEISIIEYLGKYKAFSAVIAEKLLAPMSEVRNKAAITLKNSADDRILPVILNHARSSNPINRIYLLEALNHLYDIRFQKLVISLLNDENKSVRIYAVQCAMDNDIKESVQSIKRLVQNDNNDEVRKRAIQALVFFKDPGAGSIIASVVKEGKKDLSLAAIKALRELKYSSAAGPLSEMLLRDTDDELKAAIIDALANFGRAGNIEGLQHIITKDGDPGLRIRAVYALGEVAEERNTMDILIAALSDSDYRVRGEVCSAMGKIRKNRPSQLLLTQIKKDNSRYVRSAALYSIERIKDGKDLIPLFDIYSVERDPVFREMLKDYLRSSMVKLIR